MSELTYAEVGATAEKRLPSGYHHVRESLVIGHGRGTFERAATELLEGQAQRRAGADVQLSDVPLRKGSRVVMRLRIGPLRFRIPCLVVWAERTSTSCGFAYGTLPGHPERGEERFEVRLTETGAVVFSIVAFSAPGRWFTRIGGPIARRVQTRMTRRYLEALRSGEPRLA
ncbi:DUF1990 family protein [Pseudoclavibacter sp. VKM Ac-2867]|uniref:DUF1990 family protein n=1 Tax=Pseudoclavibacter sp. VKM Ac-2867 TaxID=2783829 RepID=UPI00188B2848|nr:DUF1990 domain-containing protein [Pseudoclavibacter sp. VKM Ac-2867]MBF4458138.1 DUF1990 domain-containing protein [Pseudoclavibacter sp. VKM Ac-2867]